jgi:hypothetical protein
VEQLLGGHRTVERHAHGSVIDLVREFLERLCVRLLSDKHRRPRMAFPKSNESHQGIVSNRRRMPREPLPDSIGPLLGADRRQLVKRPELAKRSFARRKQIAHQMFDRPANRMLTSGDRWKTALIFRVTVLASPKRPEAMS